MAKFKIKKDDLVVVTAGNHKGATGKVLQVLTEQDRILVEKVNLVKRQVKPSGDRAGGTIEKEAPLHISNVALWNAGDSCKQKAAWKLNDDGSKLRVDRKTGAPIDAA
jgi:large subunit ribosomal protein L24